MCNTITILVFLCITCVTAATTASYCATNDCSSLCQTNDTRIATLPAHYPTSYSHSNIPFECAYLTAQHPVSVTLFYGDLNDKNTHTTNYQYCATDVNTVNVIVIVESTVDNNNVELIIAYRSSFFKCNLYTILAFSGAATVICVISSVVIIYRRYRKQKIESTVNPVYIPLTDFEIQP